MTRAPSMLNLIKWKYRTPNNKVAQKEKAKESHVLREKMEPDPRIWSSKCWEKTINNLILPKKISKNLPRSISSSMKVIHKSIWAPKG